MKKLFLKNKQFSDAPIKICLSHFYRADFTVRHSKNKEYKHIQISRPPRNGSFPPPSEKEKVIVVLNCLLLEVMTDLDEWIVRIIEQKFEVLKKFILVRRHHIVQKRIALALIVFERFLLKRQTFKRCRTLQLLQHRRLGHHLRNLFQNVRHVKIKGLDYAQVLGVTQVLVLLLSLGLELFYVGAEDAHFLVQIVRKIEVVELSEPQLVIVVVQRFFGDADRPRSLRKTHFFHACLYTRQMQCSPSHNELY